MDKDEIENDDRLFYGEISFEQYKAFYDERWKGYEIRPHLKNNPRQDWIEFYQKFNIAKGTLSPEECIKMYETDSQETKIEMIMKYYIRWSLDEDVYVKQFSRRPYLLINLISIENKNMCLNMLFHYGSRGLVKYYFEDKLRLAINYLPFSKFLYSALKNLKDSRVFPFLFARLTELKSFLSGESLKILEAFENFKLETHYGICSYENFFYLLDFQGQHLKTCQKARQCFLTRMIHNFDKTYCLDTIKIIHWLLIHDTPLKLKDGDPKKSCGHNCSYIQEYNLFKSLMVFDALYTETVNPETQKIKFFKLLLQMLYKFDSNLFEKEFFQGLSINDSNLQNQLLYKSKYLLSILIEIYETSKDTLQKYIGLSFLMIKNINFQYIANLLNQEKDYKFEDFDKLKKCDNFQFRNIASHHEWWLKPTSRITDFHNTLIWKPYTSRFFHPEFKARMKTFYLVLRRLGYYYLFKDLKWLVGQWTHIAESLEIDY